MKGSSVPLKKGSRNKFTTGVMVLVVLSLFVPLIFSICGFHNKVAKSGFGSEGSTLATLVEDVREEENYTESNNNNQKLIRNPEEMITQPNNAHRVRDKSDTLMRPSHNDKIIEIKKEVEEDTSQTDTAEGDGIDKSCEERFGSYCLWCKEHKEVMQDSLVKKMKDRLFIARSYYPSIAKKNQTYEPLSRELKQNIQEFERVLSDATTDADIQSRYHGHTIYEKEERFLPTIVEHGSFDGIYTSFLIHQKIEDMEAAIAKAEAEHVGCYNVDKKLAQILDMTKDEAVFHRHQSAFLYHLGAQTMPKSHHCLSMRLTVEYFRSHMNHIQQIDHVQTSPVGNPDAVDVLHYVIFSKNILSSSVVVNSTLTNAKATSRIVFYLVTDTESYFAMLHWFSRDQYSLATIRVKNIDDYKLQHITADNVLHLSSSEEFRVSITDSAHALAAQKRTEYLAMFSHAYFFLPEILSKLNKVVVLDDDVVVQRDLSPLWDLNMQGKVIGAPLSCRVRLGHFKGFAKAERWDDNECLWISGVSVIDLERWRELNLFQKYQKWFQTQKMDATSLRMRALPANLATLNGLIYRLDNSWILSGLGYKYGISDDAIKSAAVIHYNGNMKPWLEMGIPQYKRYWRRFLKKGDQYMDDCNVSR